MAENLLTALHLSKQPKNKETLVRSLDDLLEHYLHLIDQYQTVQQSMIPLFSRVKIDSAELRSLILNMRRVIYHLPEPTSQIRIKFATVRITTTIECRHQLACTMPIFWYEAMYEAHEVLILKQIYPLSNILVHSGD